MNYVLSQVLGGIAIIILIIGGLLVLSRKAYLIAQMAANAIFAVHFFLLGSMAGGVVCLITIALVICNYFKGINKFFKSYAVPFIFILIFGVSAIITWVNTYSLLPALANSVVCVGLWFDNEKKIKAMQIPCCILWGIYSLVYRTWVGVIGQSLILISMVVYIICSDKYVQFSKQFTDKVRLFFKKEKA